MKVSAASNKPSVKNTTGAGTLGTFRSGSVSGGGASRGTGNLESARRAAV